MNEIQIVLNIPTIVLLMITLLLTGACFFFIGYFIAKREINGVFIDRSNKPSNFFDNNKSEKIQTIKIDDAKFVTEIKTDGMEKKYDQLGDVKQSAENITNSINKLKNLKR